VALDELHTAGSGFIESFDSRYPTRILETLLRDRTTGHNIIWADNEYEALGDGYMGDDEITVEKITGLSSGVIKPRVAKEREHQSQRTKTRAEVFTPSWLVNRMNNDLDAVWFGVRGVFNMEEGATWHTSAEPVTFPKKKGHGWHAYVESPRLEITCGEAPFVCSRYDTVTGDALLVTERIGFLDRKLRVVSEKTKSRHEWMRWGLVALKASYGFEYQGDNLLLARINVFETFCEHLRERWGAGISDEELDQAAWIVSWNFWQMNGLTCAVPTNKMDAVVQSALFDYEEPKPEPAQPTLFDLLDEPPFGDAAGEEKEEAPDETVPLCVIYDWQENEPLEFVAMKGEACPMGKKFYAVIGNPPYQEERNGEGTTATPLYDKFMDSSYEVTEKAVLITPARFLFNAGYTPKPWNKKMLEDKHFKVLDYNANAASVFANVDIKGGVAITYWDRTKDFGAIETFTPFPPLNTAFRKVAHHESFESLTDIIVTSFAYHFTSCMYEENPSLKGRSSKGHEYDLQSNAFGTFPEIFHEEKPASGEYIRILGRESNKRCWRFIERKYVNDVSNLDRFKLFFPKAAGSGHFGEILPSPTIGEPGDGGTVTFLSVGSFDSISETSNCAKYIKTKFVRALLGVLKVTQDITPGKWKYVPIQDFTLDSDIDWSKSVSEIDQQLYAKYGLSDEEIDFIESHVKEME
jgi:hypothetical protein